MALVSQFLLDDHAEDLEVNFLMNLPGYDEKSHIELGPPSENWLYTYDHLKKLDPVAMKQYLSLYLRFGELPRKLFQGNTMQAGIKRISKDIIAVFVCVDATLPALDLYVNQKVDLMVSAGLLEEVHDIYKSNADYTRGLRQAIGVREFEDFLSYWNSECQQCFACRELFKEHMQQIMNSSVVDQQKLMLKEAIEKVQLNTRRLVRRQKRRISLLETLFGWKIHFVDVTGCLQCTSDNLWHENVVEPSVNIIKSFLDKTAIPEANNQDS